MSAASDNLSAELVTLAESIRSAATDPAVQIRLLIELADFFPATDPTFTGASCRRAALTSLCRASSNYAPSSYQDAVQKRATIVALLDAEIIVAADSGATATYDAFRALRLQVSNDLTTKAGSLPSVTTITVPASMPALVLAYTLFADATRSDDLVARANPADPNFMPTVFEALAS
jgi:prophage DNA circulation protein